MNAICTDNSTECLLRILIETTANQTSPWEPRSFGFTVAIGVAAFLISFVAIFQGLLAAGPGRIKASSNAIGAFSTLTKGKLSWIEFAWRSTAYIPFVNYEELYEGLKRQKPRVPHGTNYPFSASSINTGATWLQLFRSIGLNEEVEEIFHPVLQPCATDHLPADIQAPPMSISLQCLAILAAIADPTITFESADRFITIQGRISQVSFREHPVLGTIGGYERYQSKIPTNDAIFLGEDLRLPKNTIKKQIIEARNVLRKRLRTREETIEEVLQRNRPAPIIKPFATLGRCTPLALDLSRGLLRLHYGWCNEDNAMHEIAFTIPSSESTYCGIFKWHMPHKLVPHRLGNITNPYARAIALMVAQTDYEVRPFPWKKFQFDDVVKYLDRSTRWLFANYETFKKHMAIGNGYVESRGYTDRNPEHDLLFEWRGSWIVAESPHFDIGGDFGERMMTDIYNDCTSFLEAMRADETKQKSDVRDTTHLWMGHESMVWFSLKHVDILLRRKGMDSIDALDALTQKTINTEVANQAPTPESENTSQTPSSSLSHSPTQDSTTRAPSPVPSTRVNSGTNAGAQELQVALAEPVTVGETNQPSSTSQPQASTVPVATPVVENPEATEETYLCGLLGVRAILFAALLKLGPDTSILWKPDFKDSIVKII